MVFALPCKQIYAGLAHSEANTTKAGRSLSVFMQTVFFSMVNGNDRFSHGAALDNGKDKEDNLDKEKGYI